MGGRQVIFFGVKVHINKPKIININILGFERRRTMTVVNYYSDYHESYEYHGNTAVEVTREKDGVIIMRDWIFFDSVQEAQDFFYDNY
jgi:hypothetical protein